MMGSKGRMRDPPGILRWNASYWLESSLCEKQYKCHFLTRSHISSIFRQFPSLLVQLKARCAPLLKKSPPHWLRQKITLPEQLAEVQHDTLNGKVGERAVSRR